MAKSIWENPVMLEMRVAQIIGEQAKNGVNFNKSKAAFGVFILKERIINIDKVLIPQLPMMLNKGTSYKKPFVKSGKFSKFPGEYAARVGLKREEVGGPFTAVWYTPFDAGKVDRLKHVMLDHGWVPAIWNNKKNPLEDLQKLPPAVRLKATDEALNKYVMNNILGNGDGFREAILKAYRYRGKRTVGNLKEFLKKERYWITSPKITPDEDKFTGESGLLQLIRDRMVWSHRKSLLEGLISNVRPDGKLSGEANPCATPTARMRHRIVVNIPAARAPFGSWCRSLFVGYDDPSIKRGNIYKNEIKEGQRLIPHTNLIEEWDKKKNKWKIVHSHKIFVPKGQQAFVGYDGSGLELRMLAHYINDADYTHQILEGDIHTYNQHLAGLPTRDAAKTFIYAFNYGAGDAKLGSIVGGGKSEGTKIRARFLKANPKLKALIEKTQKDGENGYVYGIDGRKLWLRQGNDGKYQTHKALNVLLQGAGAIVMKYAMVILDNEVRKLGLRATKCLDIHDEGQWSCHPDDVPALRACMDDCVRKAGIYLKLNCPLASDSIVGCSWLDTH